MPQLTLLADELRMLRDAAQRGSVDVHSGLWGAFSFLCSNGLLQRSDGGFILTDRGKRVLDLAAATIENCGVSVKLADIDK